MTNHFAEAEKEIEHASYIANADRWNHETRAIDVTNSLLGAQVHATLALVQAIEERGITKCQLT